jgi:hypothetical protein
MRASFAFVLASIALAIGGAARAQESLDDIDKGKTSSSDTSQIAAPKSSIAEVNGYLDDRITGSWIDPSGPVPTKDQPSLQNLLEANVQLKVNLGSKAFAYGDLSLLFSGGWLFYASDGNGGRMSVDDHDVPSLRPFIALNELYLSVSPKSWLNLLAGKKRIVWGSGFAFNPTDLVNPPKDPTDPNFQRTGAWLARIEAPFEKFTLTALAAPSVLYQQNGLPYQLLRYPDYLPAGETTKGDGDYHYLLAGRLYALVANADLNLLYFFSNKYNDAFVNKSRFGLSFSRYFLTDYELHVEALFQEGSARSFPNHACLVNPGGPGCTDPVNMAFTPSKLDNGAFQPRVIVGMRTIFKDESSLSIEYYYQSDGYSDLEFEDLVRGLVKANQLGLMTTLTPSSNGALPSKFTFDPLRRHYLIANFSKPKIKDDWTVGITLIAGLRDLSGLISPTVSWNVLEWLTLSAIGYVPIRGLGVGEVPGGDGKTYSEYALLPFDWRVLFEARAFY